MFNLKTASIEIRKIAALSGIKSGRWEPVSSGSSPDSLVMRGLGDSIIARVENKNKSIEITAQELIDAHLLR